LTTPDQSLLGKPAPYVDRYDPSLLFALSRTPKRQELGLAGAVPFFGADLWTAFELSWLTPRGKPQVAIAHVTVPCETPNIVESKSFKLYLNSFNNTRFADASGLRSENQSTAEDLARMVRAAHTYPIIHELTTSSSYDLQAPIYKQARNLAQKKLVLRNIAFRNTNKLVNEKDWQIGISKTGFISEAGHCLVMQATIANQDLIIVLLDASGKYMRIEDAERVKRWLESSNNKRPKRIS